MNVDKIKGSNWKDILLMVFVFLLSLIVAVPVIKLGTDMFGYDAEHAKFVALYWLVFSHWELQISSQF